jgi:hypothetical protein
VSAAPFHVAQRLSPVIPMSARAIKGVPVAEVCRIVVACTMALRASAPTTSTPLCSVPRCNGQDARRSSRTQALQTRRCRDLLSPAASQPSGQRGHRHVPRQLALAESPAVRAAPAPRCASTGESDPGSGELVRSPGPGQRHPQDWRGRCRRATLASPARPQGSPAGTACAPLACSKEIVMRGRQGTRPTRLCQDHFHLPPWPSTMIPRGWTPCGPCQKQGAAHRDALACTSAAVTNSARRLRGPQLMALNLSHIWTHPGLQGQVRVTARRITTARIYTACSMEDTCASRP